MSRRRALTYFNCFCCSKTHSVDDLIEMGSNQLQVCEEMLEFHDLILDVCSLKLNNNVPNYICLDCKEKLVQFHVFKKNIKGYSDFKAHVKNCEVLLKMEPLLADCEHLEDVQSKKYGVNIVMLAPADFHDRFEAYEKTCMLEPALSGSLPKQEAIDTDPIEPEQTMSEGGPEDEVLHLVDEESLKRQTAKFNDSPEQTVQSPSPIKSPKIEKKKTKRNSLPVQSRDLDTSDTPQQKRRKVQQTPPASSPKSEKKAKRTSLSSESRRWNTNESLTPEQKDWINQQATIGTTQDAEGTHWRCSQCSKGFCSSWVLRKHLRDVHIINRIKSERASPPRSGVLSTNVNEQD